MKSSIDFVFTWVNGNDKKWIKKKKLYLEGTKSKFDKNDDVRFRDYDTLRYALRSVEKYAPWVRKIFLITDDQKPKWLNNENEKLIVIDHSQIIDKKYLPLFNSNAIELNMDKIPGLSENFVYFNDDMLLTQPTNSKDFFNNNLPCDFRIYSDIIPIEDFNHIPINNEILLNKYINNNWPLSKNGLVNKVYGKHQLKELPFLIQAKKRGIPGYIEPHGPLSFKKETFQKGRKIWKKEFESMNTHRFRSKDDISIWLLRHLQLEFGQFNPINPDRNRTYPIDNLHSLKLELEKGNALSICINDNEVSDYNKKIEEIKELLQQKYPKKSQFEK